MYEVLFAHTKEYYQSKKEYERIVKKVKKGTVEMVGETIDRLESLKSDMVDTMYDVPSWEDLLPYIEKRKSLQNRLHFLNDLFDEIKNYSEKYDWKTLVFDRINAEIEDLDKYYSCLTNLKDRIAKEIEYLNKGYSSGNPQSFMNTGSTETFVEHDLLSPQKVETFDYLRSLTWLTSKQAAKYLGITLKTLQNRISAKEIPESVFSGSGKSRVFNRHKLEAYRAGKPIDTTGFQKIYWRGDFTKLRSLITKLEREGYIDSLSDVKDHFSFQDALPEPVASGVNWLSHEGDDTLEKTCVSLVSLVIFLHERDCITLESHGTAYKIIPYLMNHFTMNGKAIAKRTAQNAVGKVRNKKSYDLIFPETIQKILDDVFV